MGRAAGVSRRRKKVHKYNRNLKKLHKKMIAKPKIRCDQLKESWDAKKSYLNNMQEFGLSDDPNRTLNKKQKKKAKKRNVIEALEAEANTPQPKTLRVPTEAMKFSIYMMEKYGDDYDAMFKDPKNYYQETAAVIRKKINKFKSVPAQWNGYLRAKGLLNTETSPDEFHINLQDITSDKTDAPMEE